MTDNPRSRSFAESVAALAEEDRARWETRDTFHDGKGDVTLIRGYHASWHVEWTGEPDDYCVTAFSGPAAETRARAYFAALKSGALKVIRSADAHGPGAHGAGHIRA